MGKLIINSYEEFEQYVGKVLGTSPWQKIDQAQINQFADATMDHQWIHVDEERARKDGPYGATIAHGYLTVSLLAYHWYEIIEVKNTIMLVNYGIENLKFGVPVVVDSEVRVITKLKSITNLRGTAKTEVEVEMEIKGSKRSAYKGVIVFLYRFK